MRALLIIFNLSEIGKLLPYLKKIKNNKQWFDFLTLKDNKMLFGKMLQEWISLEKE